jgi:1-acyl-sn-glycerol-3-phosphate acyltransferase
VLIRVCFRVRVEGLENVPRAPFIIASNHQAWYDTLVIVTAFPKGTMVYTMAKRETVFNRAWKRWILTRCGVFPISPSHGELDEQGVSSVYQVLARGGIVLIFPEGRYSRGRALRPLKKGVAHFALQAGVPISPVAITGVDRLRPFGRITVSIGPAIRPDPPAWWGLNRRVVRVIDSVRRAILHAFGRDPDQPVAKLRDRVTRRLRRLLRRGRSEPPATAPEPT